MPWITVFVLSLLMLFTVSVDMKEHNNRRSSWWLVVAFIFSFFGAVAYIVYDRLKERHTATTRLCTFNYPQQ